MYELSENSPARLLFMSVQEAADVLRVSRQHIYRLVDDGQLEARQVRRDQRGLGIVLLRGSVMVLARQREEEQARAERRHRERTKSIDIPLDRLAEVEAIVRRHKQEKGDA